MTIEAWNLVTQIVLAVFTVLLFLQLVIENHRAKKSKEFNECYDFYFRYFNAIHEQTQSDGFFNAIPDMLKRYPKKEALFAAQRDFYYLDLKQWMAPGLFKIEMAKRGIEI